MSARQPTKVVFDIGNVLLRWDPRHLYRQIFEDEEEMEWFLSHICTHDWNVEQDRGRDWDEAVALLVKDHPKHESAIRAFHERWTETVEGSYEQNVTLLLQLREAGVPNYCITNFSGQKFILAKQRFPFLADFDGIIVSGDERLLKPDPAIYYLLFDRYGLEAEDCVFIDDSRVNIEAAGTIGMHAIHYPDEQVDLAAELRRYGFPV
ncbi:2-haloalkanoic acid dehalogenase [Microvirga vignae]|uniref:2-haloalkanoic acid dehalogenase n=1 Tax=Microvirga vignae TaxID=1225564 RepID=A0A0H1RHZ7_9HYPH|nr:HAD family phosphatase [Microvirga vignae]KLK94456.1 2-haloalkanoic acid dehalogenase [Microvirga vignae]